MIENFLFLYKLQYERKSKKSLIPSSVQETLILKDPDKKITDQGFQITNFRSQISDHKFQITNCRSLIADH